MSLDNKHNRTVWIDVLNIVACIGVVLLHCSNNEIHNYDGILSSNYIWGSITHTLAFWPVPIFLMISGCNLIGKQYDLSIFYKKRFYRTVIPFIFWSLFYAAVYYHDEELSISEFVDLFIHGKLNGHMWFFIPLFAFYLSYPFVNLCILGGGNVKIYIILSLAMTSLLSFVLAIFDLGQLNLFPISGGYLFIPVLGYYMNSIQLSLKNRRYVYLLGILSCLIHFLFLIFQPQYNSIVLQYQYPTSIIMAVAIFVLFKNVDWSNYLSKIKISTNTISQISSCSLGVYLIHGFFITLCSKFFPYISNPYYGFIIIYGISLLIVRLMKRIKYLNYIVP